MMVNGVYMGISKSVTLTAARNTLVSRCKRYGIPYSSRTDLQKEARERMSIGFNIQTVRLKARPIIKETGYKY